MIEIELGTYLINPRWLSLVLACLLALSMMVIVVQRILGKRRKRDIADLRESLTKARLEAGWTYGTSGIISGLLIPPPPHRRPLLRPRPQKHEVPS